MKQNIRKKPVPGHNRNGRNLASPNKAETLPNLSLEEIKRRLIAIEVVIEEDNNNESSAKVREALTQLRSDLEAYFDKGRRVLRRKSSEMRKRWDHMEVNLATLSPDGPDGWKTSTAIQEALDFLVAVRNHVEEQDYLPEFIGYELGLYFTDFDNELPRTEDDLLTALKRRIRALRELKDEIEGIEVLELFYRIDRLALPPRVVTDGLLGDNTYFVREVYRTSIGQDSE